MNGSTRRQASIVWRLAEGWVGRIVFLALMLVLWEWGVAAFHIPTVILPLPSRIFRSLVTGLLRPLNASDGYYVHIAVTVEETLLGFFIGGLLGFVLGGILAEIPLVRSLLLPYILAFNSLPKVALAPLVIIWFGFGMSSKVVLSALLVFLPLMINTMAGLSATDEKVLRLFRSLRASRWQLFRMVQLPNSLPYVFAGLEVGIIYSLIGAVVGEFIGAYKGLGLLITLRDSRMDIPGVFAIFIQLSIIGIVLHQVVIWIRRKVIFWQRFSEEQRAVGL